jgi:acetyl esterase/lipase
MTAASISAMATPFPRYSRRYKYKNFLSYTMTGQGRARNILVAFLLLLLLLLLLAWPVVVRGTFGGGRDFGMTSNENERMIMASRYEDTNNNNNNIIMYHPSGPPLPLWPDKTKIPGERPGRIGKETVICRNSNNDKPATTTNKCPTNRRVTNVTIPTLIPFLVPSSDSVMIVAPGGGYQLLAMDKEGTEIAQWLNSIGISAFVLKYRVPDRDWLPFGAAPLMDAQRAMGMVRAMAATATTAKKSSLPLLPKLNSSKIGFMGFSAGGHLTGHLNVAWHNRSYHHVDHDVDQVSCRPDLSIMIYPWRSVSQFPVKEPITGASALNVTHETPPTMLVQTEDDPYHVENSIYYYLALKQHKASPSELHVYPTGGHGYGRCTNTSTITADLDVCTWPDRALDFFKTHGMIPKQQQQQQQKEVAAW